MAELEMEVFRAGDYGEKGRYNETDLDAIVSDYDPQTHEAPVTIDHAQSGPAYGWVKGLRRVGDRLVATLKGLKGDFVSWLKSGAYKKRSIELYRKFASTGRPYLRAVSFLGACPPEVKGLADPVFADGGEFVDIEFAEKDAQKVKQDVREIRRERDELRREVENLRREKSRAELATFCERLRNEGQILPAWEERGLLDFLLALDEEQVLRFGESGESTALAWFCEFLENLPASVCLDEVARDAASPQTLEGTLPRPAEGVTVSPESVETHKRVLAFCEQHPGVSYTEALSRIFKGAAPGK